MINIPAIVLLNESQSNKNQSNEKEGDNGYRCKKCKTFNKFNGYVYAHWAISLRHTCECGAKYEICEGVAELIE